MVLDNARTSFAASVRGYVGALLAVAASTTVGLLIAQRWGNEPVVLLYIPAVLITAVNAGLWPALAAAVASALAYNYYFTAPYRTLLIDSPTDVVTVLILFVVAVVTSQLAAQLRHQVRIAAAHAARNATIVGFARRLLSCASEEEIAAVAVSEIAQLFHCHAVLVTGGEMPQVMAILPSETHLAPSDMAAAAMTLATGEPTGRGIQRQQMADWQFRAIASDRTVIAAVGVARDDGVPPVEVDQLALLDNLLDQAALALERARLERMAREVAAIRERDGLRSALLASVGADVKPRLNAIGAAARAMRRAGLGDKALIASVAAEAAMLDRYIDNLVELSPGSNQLPYEIGPLIIDLRSRQVRKDGKNVHLAPKEYALLVELAKHAGRVLTHAHLLRAVWGPAQAEQVEYLRVAIRALRQKLEADPAKPVLIINEPTVGYRLTSAM